MRKLTTLVFLLLTVVLHAQQITPDEAATIASEFLNSSSPQLTTVKRIGVKRVKARSDADEKLSRLYYVFNGDDNQGFVIIAGDKRAKKILGYSNVGTFDFENLPPALEWMLGQYEKEIAALSVSTTEVRAEYTRSDTREAIEPLLTTKWKQRAPYNLKCPEMDGQRCVTGCVATAFAQVMNYHKWPQRGRNSHSYEWNNNTYSIDFSQIEFDWDAMSDEYDDDSSERSKDAVATLMKACGYSVDMMYGVGGSGAFAGNIKNAAYNFLTIRIRSVI